MIRLLPKCRGAILSGMSEAQFTEADVAYIQASYVTLESLCEGRSESADEVRRLIAARRLPAPSYVFEDGTGMFPAEYFDLVDQAGGVAGLGEHFAARHRAASLAERADPDRLAADWQAYLEGTYGVCLRTVTPEAIVRKSVLVSSLCELLVLARPGSPEWRRALRAQVEELDTLEREFAPDYDRGEEQERTPTRDLVIEAARRQHPDVFAGAAAAGADAEAE